MENNKSGEEISQVANASIKDLRETLNNISSLPSVIDTSIYSDALMNLSKTMSETVNLTRTIDTSIYQTSLRELRETLYSISNLTTLTGQSVYSENSKEVEETLNTLENLDIYGNSNKPESDKSELNGLNIRNNNDVGKELELINDKLNLITENIVNDKSVSKKYKKILLNVIVFIAGYILVPLVEGVILELIDSEHSSVEEHIIEVGRQYTVDLIEILNVYLEKDSKIILKDMSVYISNRKDSERIGKVGSLQCVKIIDKKRNWSKIQFNLDKREVKGWVFTRYIY